MINDDRQVRRFGAFFEYVCNPCTICLILIGLIIMYVAANQHEEKKYVSDILVALGSGIFITTAVTVILNFFFQEEIHRHFSIVQGAEKAGIVKIFYNRKAAFQQINTEIRVSHQAIDVVGVAGKTIFHDEDISESILDVCKAHDVRVLLLDPRSKHAVDRAFIEEGNFVKGSLPDDKFEYVGSEVYRDIMYSLERLEEAHKKCDNIKTCTYDTAPILFMIRVNGYIFVEQYHYGIENKEYKIPARHCLGQHVPVIQYRVESHAGICYQAHFNYLWKTSENRKVDPGFCERIIREVREERIWLKIYETVNDSAPDACAKSCVLL